MEGGGNSADEAVTTTPSEAVLEAVADAEGIPPAELRPPAYETLHEALDPAALDALFDDRDNGTPRPSGRVAFRYCGYTVTVDNDGTVTLEEQSDDDELTDSECC